MVSTTAPQFTVRLSDYRPYPFRIPAIDLNVVVGDPLVTVTADFQVEPKDGVASTAMILRGVDLELISIAIDDQPLPKDAYSLSGDELMVRNPPTQAFKLTTASRLNPKANTSLEGLYVSGGMLTTQGEAEGFRRITFHPDRPDVLSRFRVRIEADRQRAIQCCCLTEMPLVRNPWLMIPRAMQRSGKTHSPSRPICLRLLPVTSGRFAINT